MKLLSSALAVVVFAAQLQPPTLDLTVLPSTSASGRVPAISDVNQLSMNAVIVNPPDQEYTVGDEFQYEIEITNTSTTAITIPWAADPSGFEEIADQHIFQSSLTLMVENANDVKRLLTGVLMYGRPDIPSSLMTLPPGASARFLASGRWTVAGIRMADFVSVANGRVELTAIYRLQRGTTISETGPSPSRLVTLRPK